MSASCIFTILGALIAGGAAGALAMTFIIREKL